MPYKLPEILEPDGTLELCVKIPNRPEYVRAFLASYSYLTRWVAWERDALNSASIAAGYFLQAYNQTIDLWQNCQGEGDDDVTIVNNYVDVNCGGCSGSAPTTLYCILPDGTPVITPQPPAPTEPTPPPGGEFPLDPEVDTPPEGYETWAEFDAQACLAANVLWYWAVWFVRLVETLGDILAVIATAVTLVTPFLPAGILAAIGGVVLLDILWQLVQILTAEQASDILNEVAEWLEENRQSIVCKIYRARYDYKFAIELSMDAADYIEQSVVMNAEERNAVEQFIAKLFAYTLFGAVILKQTAEKFGLETEFTEIDCSTCGTSTFRLFDDFATDTLEGLGWADVRGSWIDGWATFAPSNIAAAWFGVNNDLWAAYWGLPTPVTGTNVRLRFNWKVIERGLGTVTFLVKAKRASDGAVFTLADLSLYAGSVPIGQIQTFDTIVPIPLALGPSFGSNILEFHSTTTNNLIRIGVDNIIFEGNYS